MLQKFSESFYFIFTLKNSFIILYQNLHNDNVDNEKNHARQPDEVETVDSFEFQEVSGQKPQSLTEEPERRKNYHLPHRETSKIVHRERQKRKEPHEVLRRDNGIVSHQNESDEKQRKLNRLPCSAKVKADQDYED